MILIAADPAERQVDENISAATIDNGHSNGGMLERGTKATLVFGQRR
jgi:hypothetical protein